MKLYAKVKFIDSNKRPVILCLRAVTERFVSGIEVNKEGDEVVPKNADEKYHIIDKEAIKKMTPMKMNNTYAELEEVKEE